MGSVSSLDFVHSIFDMINESYRRGNSKVAASVPIFPFCCWHTYVLRIIPSSLDLGQEVIVLSGMVGSMREVCRWICCDVYVQCMYLCILKSFESLFVVLMVIPLSWRMKVMLAGYGYLFKFPYSDNVVVEIKYLEFTVLRGSFLMDWTLHKVPMKGWILCDSPDVTCKG